MSNRKSCVAILASGLALMLTLVAPAQESKEQTKDRSEVLKKREALMQRLERTIGQKQNVPPTDGMFLKIMAQSLQAKRVLEIGSSNGYSGLWIGQGLERTGGHLWTIEIDAARAKECRENIQEAGLGKIITSIEGDAFKVIPTLEGQFDMVFLDAWKKDYKRFFDMFFPMVRPGGVIVAHNTIRSAQDMKDYLDAVNNHPELDTVTLSTTLKDGFTISYRKKKE